MKLDIFPPSATDSEKKIMEIQLYAAAFVLMLTILVMAGCFLATKCFSPQDELLFLSAMVGILTVDLLAMFAVVFRILYRRAG